MAEFDVSITAKLYDHVSAGARTATASLRAMQAQAMQTGAGIFRGLAQPLVNLGNHIGLNQSRFIGYFTSIGAGFGKLKTVADTVLRGLGTVLGGITSVLSTVWGALRSVLLYFGLTGAGLAYMANSWAKATREQQVFADEIGMTTSRLRGLEYAANAVGFGGLKTGLEMLANSLAQLRTGDEAGGPLNTFLSKVGDTALIQKLKAAKDEAEAVDLLMTQINKQTDPVMRIALARAAFGRGGAGAARMAPDYIRLEEEARAYLNLTKSEQAAADSAAKEYTDAQNRASAAWEGMRAKVLTPIMKLVADYMDQLALWMRQPGVREIISKTAVAVVKSVASTISWIYNLNWSAIGHNMAGAFHSLKTVLSEIANYIELIMANADLMAIRLNRAAGMGGRPENNDASLLEARRRSYLADKTPYSQWPEDLRKAFPPGRPEGNWRHKSLPERYEWQPTEDGHWKLRRKTPDEMKEAPVGLPTRKPTPPIAPKQAWGAEWIDKNVPTILKDYNDWSKQHGLGATDLLKELLPSSKKAGASERGIGLSATGTGAIGSRPMGISTIAPFAPPKNISTIPPGFNWSKTPNVSPVPKDFYGKSGSKGTDLIGVLKSKLDKLTETKPAQLSANASVGGAPPAGITIQARGPSVHISQAPPNVNISVSVNVLKPDAAPSATATAVGSELGRQIQSSWGDGTAEA